MNKRIIAGLVLLAAFLIAVDFYVAHFVFREQAATLERQVTIQAQMLAAQLPSDATVRDLAARAQTVRTIGHAAMAGSFIHRDEQVGK